MPEFTYTRLSSALDAASGQEAMKVDLPTVYRSSLLRVEGEAVRAAVTAEESLEAREYVSWTPTALLGDSQFVTATIQNISWRGPLIPYAPEVVRNISIQDLPPLSTGVNEFRLRIEGGPDVQGTASITHRGANITIAIPRGWEITTFPDSTLWLPTASSGHPAVGTSVSFELREDVQGFADLAFTARVDAAPSRPFDVFHASLSNGSLGESALVVRYPTSAEKDLPRQVLVTAPYPVRASSRALLGVAFVNGGPEVTVTQVDVEVPGGYDFARHGGFGAHLFNESPVYFGGTETVDSEWRWVDGRHLQWRGSRVVEELSATEWTLGVLFNGSEWATGVEPGRHDGPEGSARFANGFEASTRRWGRVPGVLELRAHNATLSPGGDGYPWADAGAAGGASLPYAVTVQDGRAAASAAGSYRVLPSGGDLVSLQGAVANSTFVIGNRTAPLGTFVRAEANLQSLVTKLSRSGVTETNLTIDMYAPPSRGCAPTTSFTRSSATMPLASATAVELWDAFGTGAPTMLLAAEDRFVYRVDAAGVPLWSTEMGSTPTLLRVGASGGEAAVVVAEADGRVGRLDLASGQPAWSARVASREGAALGGNATALALDVPRGLLLAGTSRGTLELRELASGALVASRGLAADLPVRGAGFLPDGSVWAVHGARVDVLDGGLADLAPPRVHDLAPSSPGAPRAVGVAHGGGRLLVSLPWNTTVLDAATLAVERVVEHRAMAALGAEGDATGDGVPDAVLALDDFGVLVVDGATGSVAWEHAAAPVAAADPWSNPKRFPFGDMEGHLPMDKEMCWSEDASGRCDRAGVGGGRDACRLYLPGDGEQDLKGACRPRADATQSRPVAVQAREGRVALAVLAAGQPTLQLLADGALLHAQPLDDVPAALAMGPWLDGAAPMDAVAVAGETGDVGVRRASDGREVASYAPTQFVGRFSYWIPVPMGSFFGTHLVVATLSWTDADGVAQSARMVEWFEVVEPDGSPNVEPSYHVVMVARDRAERG